MNFWQTKTLQQMNTTEWESLCDQCGKCCLHKFEDEDSGEIDYTNVSCKLLNDDCQCQNYAQRKQFVPDCIALTIDALDEFKWLPSTCAYRLLNEGKELMWWHPLVSGTQDTVVEAGISVAGRIINEEHIHPDEIENFIIRWVD